MLYHIIWRTSCNNDLPSPACRYGDNTARATVEGNILFPFIPEDKLEALQASFHIPLCLGKQHTCIQIWLIETLTMTWLPNSHDCQIAETFLGRMCLLQHVILSRELWPRFLISGYDRAEGASVPEIQSQPQAAHQGVSQLHRVAVLWGGHHWNQEQGCRDCCKAWWGARHSTDCQDALDWLP